MSSRETRAEQLNIAAFMALAGLSDAPERDLAALLRSNFEIDPIIRTMLADALAGAPKHGRISLRAEGLKNSKANNLVRKVKLHTKRARIGREAMFLQSKGESYDDAVRATASTQGISEKAVEACITFARKMDDWIDRNLPGAGSFSLGEDGDRLLLEGTYCAAIINGRDPDDFKAGRDAALARLDWADFAGEDWQ